MAEIHERGVKRIMEDINRDGPQNPEGGDIGRVLKNLAQDMTVLMHKEVELVRTELSEKVELIKASGTSLAVSTAFIFLGAQVLVAAAVLGLATVVQPWLAALIVGVVLAGVGTAMALAAKKALRPDHLMPKKSAETLSEMGTELKEKTHELYH